MSTSRIMKWVTCGLEALLAIPIVGRTIVLGFYSWKPRAPVISIMG